jgi:16S rRNA (guanine527-N7)-methyltransferase
MPDALDEVLRSAQDLGLVGPGTIGPRRRHASRLAEIALDGLGHGPVRALDLGSGGGLPGLVLAEERRGTELRLTLLDSRSRSADFLRQAVHRLGLSEVTVVEDRAESAARRPEHREHYDVVLSRGFGPPAATAECAVAFLRPAGRLVVSEPPAPDPTRWNAEGLARLGLTPPELITRAETHAAVLHRTAPLSDQWPRRSGVPTKRPLW